jgi:hypothetical protein
MWTVISYIGIFVIGMAAGIFVAVLCHAAASDLSVWGRDEG